MERVIVTQPMIGVCYMQVCAVADATDEEILEVANRENMSGTSNGWSEVAREDTEDKKLRPVDCGDNFNNIPKRKHFIVIC